MCAPLGKRRKDRQTGMSAPPGMGLFAYAIEGVPGADEELAIGGGGGGVDVFFQVVGGQQFETCWVGVNHVGFALLAGGVEVACGVDGGGPEGLAWEVL